MSSKSETYCRLCAEPTPETQLINSDEDVAKTSKIATKMQWINIDITCSDILPSTICFSCFDLLERTWNFLHNVRTAQEKLRSIFLSSTSSEEEVISLENNTDSSGKPVDENWKEFCNTVNKVKSENSVDLMKEYKSDDCDFLFKQNLKKEPLNVDIKLEQYSDNDLSFKSDHYNSSDSDLPLGLAAEKKRNRMKQKKLKRNLNSSKSESVNLTWDTYVTPCAICDAQCENITALQLHSLHIHSSCCTFKCTKCDKVINTYKSYINHVKMHEKQLKHRCNFCDAQFKKSEYVKKHKTAQHRDVHLTICTTCGMIFETLESLQAHVISYSRLTQRSIKKHQKIDWKCEYCFKEFKSKSNLDQHKLVHDLERSRNFSCHMCGKMFYTKGTLRTHMLTHEEVKQYKCEFCPLTFRARGNLQSHISLHSASKPFVCEQCGKSFRVKRHLKSHSIVHTDLMPYHCTFCEKAFRFKTRLNLHVRQHTGAKPYHCTLCQRYFTNGSNFKKHMKRRHNVDTSKKKYNNIVAEDIHSILDNQRNSAIVEDLDLKCVEKFSELESK